MLLPFIQSPVLGIHRLALCHLHFTLFALLYTILCVVGGRKFAQKMKIETYVDEVSDFLANFLHKETYVVSEEKVSK